MSSGAKRKLPPAQDGCSETRKKKYEQTFLKKYESIPGIKPSIRGLSYAHCCYCKVDFSIAHSGSYDIERHVARQKHADLCAAAKSNRSMIDFVQTSRITDKELNIIRAELMCTELVVKLNLPLTTSDVLTKTLKMAFPDSSIAQSYACGRSKATVLVKEIARDIKKDLTAHMKTGPFSIANDGSNDQKDKQFPIVVTTSSNNEGVSCKLLTVAFLTGKPATGENIFHLLAHEMEDREIPWQNCLSLGSDNANVMTGKHKGVFAFMLKKNSDIYLAGCLIHLVHHAAEKAAASLPFSIDDILVSTYYYLDKSSKRIASLDEYQKLYDVEHHKILKHVSTRWLSVGKCIDRVVENWTALLHFFKEEATKSKVADSVPQRMLAFYRSPTNHLYCLFLQNSLKIFENFNTKFQAESPHIHILRRSLHKLMRDILIRYKRPSALVEKSVLDVSLADGVGERKDEDLIIGDSARNFLARRKEVNLQEKRITEFFANTRKFFRAGCRYIKEKLPLNDELLRHAEVADVDLRTNGVTSSDVTYFINRFPCLLPQGASKETVELKFADFQSMSEVLTANTIDKTWVEIAKLKDTEEEFRFHNLSKVILGILTIPHSNASCERVFSCVRKNKTEQRAGLGSETLDALLVVKSNPGEPHLRTYSTECLRKLKSSYYRSLNEK